MGQYTNFLEDKMLEISPEDDNYEEELAKAVMLFRSFDESLTDFIINQGYEGAVDDTDAKIEYIKSKFETIFEPVPRNIKKWFTEHTRVDREIAFQFCFAFNLSIEESNQFLRKVCLQRGFDCHRIEEAIYYYCLNNQLSYSNAKNLIKNAPNAPDEEKGKIDFNNDVLFTESIVDELNRISRTEELLQYFKDNISQFGYNNATAFKYINFLWDKISGENGLANKEVVSFFNRIPRKNRSVWNIYLQILFGKQKKDYERQVPKQGEEEEQEDDYEESQVSRLLTKRSLKPILQNNKLIHPLAAYSFPERQGLEDILRGKHKSHELVRKTLILLVFYNFWLSLALKDKNSAYQAQCGDTDKCIAEINKYLVDTGYPELYAGNPYDWIFMFAANDDGPLNTFRGFMNELFYVKEDEIREKANKD